MKIGYISLEIDEKDKSLLTEYTRSTLREKDFCHLRYKGGIVTRKAHLTLFFGLDYDRLDMREIERDLEMYNQRIKSLIPEKTEIFPLGRSRCRAWVMRIRKEQILLDAHEHFRQKYPLVESYIHREFKPHITLAYIQKSPDIIIDTQPPSTPLKVSKALLKIFTA